MILNRLKYHLRRIKWNDHPVFAGRALDSARYIGAAPERNDGNVVFHRKTHQLLHVTVAFWIVSKLDIKRFKIWLRIKIPGHTTTSGIRGNTPFLRVAMSWSVWPWALKSLSIPSSEYVISVFFNSAINSDPTEKEFQSAIVMINKQLTRGTFA